MSGKLPAMEFTFAEVRSTRLPSENTLPAPFDFLSPTLAIREGNVQEEAADIELQRESNERVSSRENNLEVPVVLLSPCTGMKSKPEKGLNRMNGNSSGFLSPPPRPSFHKRCSSSADMRINEGATVCFQPRKFCKPASWSDHSHHGSLESVLHQNTKNNTNSKRSVEDCVIYIYKEDDDAITFNSSNGHSLIEASNKDLTALMQDLGKVLCKKQGISSRAFLADAEFDTAFPLIPSLCDLNPTSPSSKRSPQSQACSLRSFKDDTALTSVSSGQLADQESVKNCKGTAKFSPLQRNPRLSISQDAFSCTPDVFPLPLTAGVTRFSAPCLTRQSLHLFPNCDMNNTQSSAPDVTLSFPSEERSRQNHSDQRCNSQRVVRSSPKLKCSSPVFLHPDTAYSLSNRSSKESSTSFLQVHSSQSSFSGSSRTLLSPPGFKQTQPGGNSPSPSTLLTSSGRSDSSFLDSFLSLISPSKLLSKLRSFSGHSTQSNASRSPHRRRRREIDYPNDEKIVTLNVGGRRFKIQDYFLSVYPTTLLGGKARGLFYDESTKEFFFDRDSDCFHYIWKFYSSGKLHCPRGECVQMFLDEVNFFGLDTTMLCDCCWSELFQPEIERIEKQREEREFRKKAAEETSRDLEAASVTFRHKVWTTLKDPSFSFIAKILYLLNVLVAAISVVANTTETIACTRAIRICKEENEETYFYLDTVCVGLFSLEYIARLLTCPRRVEFFTSLMSLVDLLAILPYYINLLLSCLAVDAQHRIEALLVLRVFKIARIFKLVRHFARLQQLTQVLKSSAAALALIGFLYLDMVILFSSIIYFAEFSEDSPFSSIPETMWYAVITSTTAGYGDIVPKTLAGRLVGSACCLFGVLVIALPVPILQPK